MPSRTTKDFQKQLKKLVKQHPEFTGIVEHALQNPHLPQYRIHKLKRTKRLDGDHRAIAITHRYRAIARVDEDAWEWWWIGSHEDYNNVVS